MAIVTITIKDNELGSIDVKAYYDPPLDQRNPKPTPAQDAAARIYAMLTEMATRDNRTGSGGES